MTRSPDPNDLESIVDRALVRIDSLEGRTLGTGFFATPAGSILTCHHVIADQPLVRVVTWAGETFTVEPAVDAALAVLDLALLSVGGTAHPALPIRGDGTALTRFWTKGFQFQS